MDEATIKQSFRIAYDFVMNHQHPQFNVDYFMSVLEEIKGIHQSDRYNILLESLLLGVYEYLAKEAKEESQARSD